MLDCKNSQCRDIVLSTKLGSAHICPECDKHFQEVKAGLDILGVNYTLSPLLVRGLDYYTRTVFEISHPGLGAQDALGAGGRYDNLVEELGGPSRGAVGFALGVERLLLAKVQKPESQVKSSTIDCYIVPLGGSALKRSMKILKDLRKAGIKADMDYLEGSLKASLRRADAKGVKFCLILGDNELAKESCLLKNMPESKQEEVKLSNIVEKIKGLR